MTGDVSVCPRCGRESRKQTITLFGLPIIVMTCLCVKDITIIPKPPDRYSLELEDIRQIGEDADGNYLFEATARIRKY